MLILRSLVIMIIVLFSLDVYAVDHYIRPIGSGGNGSGTSWTNAYLGCPSGTTYVRGEFYYVAAGTYNQSCDFSTSLQGASAIIVCKATISTVGRCSSAHGVAGDWNDAYAAQANFTGQWHVMTGNWIFDGVSRNENDWFDRNAYGFRVGDHLAATQVSFLNCGNVFHNVTMQYVTVSGYDDFAGMPNCPSGCDLGAWAVYYDQGGCGDQHYTGMVLRRIHVTGGVNQVMPRTTTGFLLEYSAFENAIGNGANHGDVINLYSSVNNFTGRYNKFRHEYTTACGNCGSTGIFPADNGTVAAEIYGNWISDFSSGNGVTGHSSGGITNSKFYNNTIDNCATGNGGVGDIQWVNGTGNTAYNNIWTNCPNVNFLGVTHNWNAFGNNDTHSEANPQINFSTANFVSYATMDFRLVSATTVGVTLASPYNVDVLGNTRGADGLWDRGAYEFGAGGGDITPPSTPTNLRITLQSYNMASLAWDASTDDIAVAGYLIEHCVGASCSTFTQIGAPAATFFTDSPLLTVTPYSWRVRAKDTSNNLSSYSSTLTTVSDSVKFNPIFNLRRVSDEQP